MGSKSYTRREAIALAGQVVIGGALTTASGAAGDEKSAHASGAVVGDPAAM